MSAFLLVVTRQHDNEGTTDILEWKSYRYIKIWQTLPSQDKVKQQGRFLCVCCTLAASGFDFKDKYEARDQNFSIFLSFFFKNLSLDLLHYLEITLFSKDHHIMEKATLKTILGKTLK